MGKGTQKALFGTGEDTKTTVNTVNPPSQEELELIKINTELARKQLANVDALQPFQQELVDLSMAELRRQGVETAAMDAAVSPEQRAQAAKDDFDRAQRLGPIQDELLQMQLETARQGGKATPEQLALIKEATDRSIESGTADIDLSTKRGIGMISDELANSRGLRLSDSPIMNEAGQLVAGSEDLKANLIRSMRANEASAALNFPLASSQVTSGITMNQQNLAEQAQQFQAELGQRAFQNRLSFTGQTAQSGIGLSAAGSGVGAHTVGSLAGQRGGGQSVVGWDPSKRMAAGGQLMSGIGSLMGSDRRLKDDYGVVAKTDRGLNLHLFKYKWEDESDPLRFGVMAQEVEKVKPEAVVKNREGIRFVDYSRL